MGILTEQEMFFRAAERAFYRNPFSDLLIVSLETLNRDDDEWKGLVLPVVLVCADGTLPEATRREIARRRNANLFVWGSPEVVPDSTLDILERITRGRVYRIARYVAAGEEKPGDPAIIGDGDGGGEEKAEEVTKQPGAGQDSELTAPPEEPSEETAEFAPKAEQAGAAQAGGEDTVEAQAQPQAEHESEIAQPEDEPCEEADEETFQPEETDPDHTGEFPVQHQEEQESVISAPSDDPVDEETILQQEEINKEEVKEEVMEEGIMEEDFIEKNFAGDNFAEESLIEESLIEESLVEEDINKNDNYKEDTNETLNHPQTDTETAATRIAAEEPELESKLTEDPGEKEEHAEATEEKTSTESSPTPKNILVWRFPS